VKYVGLLALAKITHTHADLVSDHHDLILSCIEDTDISIRLRALDLIVGMVTRDTLPDIVKQLMIQLLDPPPDSTSPVLPEYFRIELVRRILAMTTKDNYAYIGNNFEWYVAVLVDLARIAKVDVGKEIGDELLNVTVRVKSVRQFSVRVLKDLLRDYEVMIGGAEKAQGQAEVLGAAAWIIGEYAKYLLSLRVTDRSLVEFPKTALEALLSPYVEKFSPKVQGVYIQAVPKVFSMWATEVTSSWSHEKKIEIDFVLEQILTWLDPFRYSTNLEVQERACGFDVLFKRIQSEIRDTPIPEPRPEYPDEATASWDEVNPQTRFQTLSDLAALFSGMDLNPVSAKAQRKVPIPEGLDLNTSLFTSKLIYTWPEVSLEEEERPKPHVAVASSISEQRPGYLDRIRDDPFYIGDNRRPLSRSETPNISGEDDFDSIPIVQFDGGTNLLTPITQVKKKKKAREIVLEDPVDIAIDEMPENAALSDNEADGNGKMPRKTSRKNVLSSNSGKALEDIDFEEEERLEREAIEAERRARQNRVTQVPVQTEVISEQPLVERVKKKKKKGTAEGSKVKRKKDKEKAEGR